MKASLMNYLGSKFGEQAVCNACSIIDGIWGLTSMVAAILVPASFVFMLVEQPSIVGVSQESGGPTVVVSQSVPVYLESPVSLGKDVRKAAFATYIQNEKEEVVYNYPEVITDNPKQKVSFKLPVLPDGVYYVRTSITYQLNPIKNAVLDVGVARVIVENLEKGS